MDGDTGILYEFCNVKYKVENERGYSATRFNRNKSEYRGKKKRKFGRHTERNTIEDLAYLSVNNDKSSIESKQYIKRARRKEIAGMPFVDFKPVKSMLSSFSFVDKDKIKESSSIASYNVVVVNKHQTHDLNVKRRVTNEVKVLYEHDINEDENAQNIYQRKSSIKCRHNDNSQMSLFGFQHCLQRKPHLNILYNFFQSDAKRDKCLCCKHYSIEDVNPEKSKKKSSFVKSKRYNPAAPNSLKVTERTTVSNIYISKPKDAKKSVSFKTYEIPCSCLDLHPRKSILKKGDGVDNVNVQTLKTKSKEKSIATTDLLKRRSFSGGPTAVNVLKPIKLCKKWVKTEPVICECCKQSKYTGVFSICCAAIKYLLFMTIVIIWLPYILLLCIVWFITYPFRPHQAEIRKTKIKTTSKPRQNTSINKIKRSASVRKNKATSYNTNRKKMTGTNCQKKSSRSSHVNLPDSATNLAVSPREGSKSSLVVKKRHKSVTFKQTSNNRGTGTFRNASKSKHTACSGFWTVKRFMSKSVNNSLDKNNAKQNKKQNMDLDKRCQEFLSKSCRGNDRMVEVCAPKSLSKVLQTALSGVCSNNDEFASVSKLSMNKSSNTINLKCVKYTKKRKFSNRRCSTTTPTKQKAVSTTSVIQCVVSPCPGGCAITQAINLQAAKGNKSETVTKYFPPPYCKTSTVGSGIKLRVSSISKSTLAPLTSRCDRTVGGKRPFKPILIHKLYPSLRASLRTVSNNTIKLKTSVPKSKEKKQIEVQQEAKNLKKLEKQKGKDVKKCGKEDKIVNKLKKGDKKDIMKLDKEKDKNVKKCEKKEKKDIKKRNKEEDKIVKQGEKAENKSVKTFENEENMKVKKSANEKEKSVMNPKKENENSVKKRQKKDKQAYIPNKLKGTPSIKSDKGKETNKPGKEKCNPGKKRKKEEKKVNNMGKLKGNAGKKREEEKMKVKTPHKEEEKKAKKYNKPFYVIKYFPAPRLVGRHKSSNTTAKMSAHSLRTEPPKCNTVQKYVSLPQKSSKNSGFNVKKYFTAPSLIGRHKSSNTIVKMSTHNLSNGPPKSKTVLKYIPLPREGSVSSRVYVKKYLPAPRPTSRHVSNNTTLKMSTHSLSSGPPKSKSVLKYISLPQKRSGTQRFYVKKYLPAPRPTSRHVSSNTTLKMSTHSLSSGPPKSKTVIKYISLPQNRSVTQRFNVKKYLPAPRPTSRHVSSNTTLKMFTHSLRSGPPKSKTVLKYISLPQERSVTSGINTSKDMHPSRGKRKSKSSSACLKTATKIIKYLPKPRSYSVGSITTEVKFPLKPIKKQKTTKKNPPGKEKIPPGQAKLPPRKDKTICKPISKPTSGLVLQDRKSFAKRRSQEMIPNKPRTIYKFFPSPIPCTRSISIDARLQDKVKVPRKSSKSTSFPQRRLFGSLTGTMATNTCSIGPTRIFKYIKSKRSFMTRRTVPIKLKEEKRLKSKSRSKSESESKSKLGSGSESESKSDTSIKKSRDKTIKKGKNVANLKRKKEEKRRSRARFFIRRKYIDKTIKRGKKPVQPKRKKKEKRPSRVTFFVRRKCVDKTIRKSMELAKLKRKKKEERPSRVTIFVRGKSAGKYIKKGEKPAKPKLKQKVKRSSRDTLFVRGESISKRSTASSTTRVCTKSTKVTSNSAPLIKYLLPKKSSRSTRGVNPRKEKFCFMKELRDFSKKQVCKYRKTSEIIPKRILIYKRPDRQAGDRSPKSSRSAPSTATGPSKNKLVRKKKPKLKAKEKNVEKRKDQATALILKAQKARAKELAKQRAEERAQAIALQKAEFRLQDIKAQQEMDRLKKKNRKKARTRKPKLTFKQNVKIMLKNLNPASINMECTDLIAKGPKPYKRIYDLWPSAYPLFMVLYKMYNNIIRLLFFFLACCVWSPLFCWCFLFYFFIIKKLLC